MDVTAVSGDDVLFTCVASGLPAPTITWIISPPSTPITDNTTTSVDSSNMEVEGRLMLTATQNVSVVCVAGNRGENVSSNTATLTIAGTESL